MAGTVAIALLVVLLATNATLRRRSAREIVLDLAVEGGHRLIEPRLSGSSTYAAFFGTAPRSPALRTNVTKTERLAMDAEPGLTNLLHGEWTKALADLGRAGPARTPVDVAAAYYMRGLATESLLDFCRALEALRDADPSADVLFNRGLILEQLGDREAAAATWRQYLAADASSAWAAEARRHLQSDTAPSVADEWRRDKSLLREAATAGRTETVRALARRYPVGARRMVEQELLPAWGAALSNGKTIDAVHALDAARMIVAARPVQEERLLDFAIRDIDAAAAGASALARAYVVAAEGNKALDASDNEGARALFVRASALAGGRSAAFDALMIPSIVTSHYRRYEYADAERWIATARSRYAGQRAQFITLFARLDWLSGLIEMARPDASAALRSYQRALPAYERLGEIEYVAAQHVNQADTYFYLGDDERTGMHVRKALLLASRAEDPRRMHGILKVAATLSLESAGAAAAVVFQDRVVRLARAGADTMRVADALVSRSSILVRAGRREDALADLAEVRRIAPSLVDGPTRARLEADASAVEAFAYRDRDDRRVIESLSRAIDLFGELEMRAYLVQLLLERGRAQLRLGDASAAERDFRAGIEQLESQRGIVDEAALRIAYLDRADRVFVDLAVLLLRRGRVDDAFDLLERLRSRELLDRSSDRPVRPLPLREIRQQLPENTFLITHTVYAYGLITFVVSRERVRAFDTGTGEAVIRPLVESVHSSFGSSGGSSRDPLRRLGALLVERAAVPRGSRIIFIPDDVLYSVPFSALLHADGTYVVESHVVSVAASATLLARHFAHATDRATPRAILAVASSEPPAGFDDLAPLTRVAREAKRAAAQYGRSRIIAGSEPGAASFLGVARDYDLLHFGGHSVVDHRNPSRSSLLVGANGRITAGEIESMDLSNLDLVVLGGCETGVGKTHRSEGALSLARAFFAAGVRTVVSTIAPVEDDSSERLLTEFHRVYARDGDAPAALREAQLRMLRSSDPVDAEPAHWSSFQVIEGSGRERRR
ncbi:MAG TPA: CHAT domain-containing protein [Thermoanaerobaculia bacterium]|nr:CHAT domain-containing protein [Thermoanaerobaculia bacterium]